MKVPQGCGKWKVETVVCLSSTEKLFLPSSVCCLLLCDDSIPLFTMTMLAMFHGLQYRETMGSIISGDAYVYNINVYKYLSQNIQRRISWLQTKLGNSSTCISKMK